MLGQWSVFEGVGSGCSLRRSKHNPPGPRTLLTLSSTNHQGTSRRQPLFGLAAMTSNTEVLVDTSST
jgi:hypothetical protein